MKKFVSLMLALVLVLSLASVASADEIKDLRTYETQAREMETMNIHYSQAAADLNVLVNCIDGLLTNDASGNLVANAAKEWSSPDGGQTWVFVLNDGMKWVDVNGNVKADVVAADWVTGLEWVMNYAKNDAYNTSMPGEMIVGAMDYYNYTKQVAEEQGVEAAQALGTEKFLEMVGIETPDDKTIIYKLVDKLAYFPTVATYNCLYPLAAGLIEEIGVEGYRAVTNEQLWYSGPYTMTYYVYQNEKVLTANPNYWNKEAKVFDSVTIKMVEDGNQAYNMFIAGELDNISLPAAQLSSIYENPSNEWYPYLSEARPTKYSYQMHLVYDVKNPDGTPNENWNKAVANEAFRQSWYYGLDLTDYLARTNAINPLSCQNYTYTGKGVATNSAGVDYADLVLAELGLTYEADTYSRVDAEKAAALKKQAMEELSAQGVTFPVEIPYYISGSSQTAKDSADTLAQIFSDCLGDDYVKLNILTYVSSLANEVRKPQLCALYINGWGADFGDPVNFLGQETYNDDAAYYSNNYSMINKATDEKLTADYAEFTKLVNEAKAITGDLDARYAAFAKAEAYFVTKCFTIPCSVEVSWQMTCINPYSQVYSAYGIQTYRYVNWETNDAIYTTAEIADLAK